ncbi:MAG TPA: trypsin-like peptidase domain-containing protein [Bacteroidota bacterium]
MDSPLVSFSNEIARLAGTISPSVVSVHGRRSSASSGVHWRKNLIVTAEHALRRDDDILISYGNDEKASAKLVGRDPGTDVALLSVESLGAPAAPVGGNEELRVGHMALVVGRSPNSGPNASLGIISAVSGAWRTWRGGQLDQYLRLDATVFPGMSGGAVSDVQGRVIGIATSALSRIAGLAIPASSVNRVVDWLLEKGTVPRGYLGIGLQPVKVPETFREKLHVKNDEGVMVVSVESGGPAERAGILVGDILLDIDRTSLEDVEDLQALLGPEKIGKPVQARLVRGGELKDIAVTVGERSRRNSS